MNQKFCQKFCFAEVRNNVVKKQICSSQCEALFHCTVTVSSCFFQTKFFKMISRNLQHILMVTFKMPWLKNFNLIRLNCNIKIVWSSFISNSIYLTFQSQDCTKKTLSIQRALNQLLLSWQIFIQRKKLLCKTRYWYIFDQYILFTQLVWEYT